MIRNKGILYSDSYSELTCSEPQVCPQLPVIDSDRMIELANKTEEKLRNEIYIRSCLVSLVE